MSTSAKQNVFLTLFASLFSGALIIGCAHLAPGADPLVVRAEQTETGAVATFNLVVNEDDANRSFWKTNATAFHNFAEWLRAPITIEVTNTLPRGLALVKQLDDVKVAYVAGGGSSNALSASISALANATTQASAWMTIVSNSPSK